MRVPILLSLFLMTLVHTPYAYASSGGQVTLNPAGDGNFILTYTGPDYEEIYGMYSFQGDASFKGDIVSWGLLFGWIVDVSTLTVGVSTPTKTITISFIARNFAKQMGTNWQLNLSIIKVMYPTYSVTGNTYLLTSITKPDVRFPETVSLQLPANTISHQIDPNTYIITYQLGTTTPTPSPTTQPRQGCLIATALYGSPYEPEVQFLRHLRDETLVKIAGQPFRDNLNDWYYSFSPQVSEFIKQNQWTRPPIILLISPTISFLHLADTIIQLIIH